MNESGLVLFDGIPLHPLFVHFAVVLLLISSVLIVIALVSSKFRNSFGVAVFWVSVIATIWAFLAAFAGLNLAETLGVSETHRTTGLLLPITATVSSVFFGLYLWTKKLAVDSGLAKFISILFWVVTLVAVIGTVLFTALAGHSGSELTWVWRIQSILG